MKRDLKSLGKKNNNENNVDDIRKKTEELSRLSESELINELKRSVSTAKEQGEFSDEQVESFFGRAAAILPADKLKSMRSLLDSLR